jgi:dienelactone hydrolase
MKYSAISFLAIPALWLTSACSNQQKPAAGDTKDSVVIHEENESYNGDSVTMNGFFAYNASSKEKRPVVMIVHEWWGQNEYVKKRARELAALGYLAYAVDMYGGGMVAADPTMAKELATPFYMNPLKAKVRFDAALAMAKSNPLADTSKILAIGYCFGGSMVLNVARLGENLAGVVSFHGGLAGVPPSRDKLKAAVLICHGEVDQFVSAQEVATFKKQMDSIGAVYTFKSYPNATHAFSNPDATENGKKFNMPIAYNGAADTASWNDMKVFFDGVLKK